MKWELGALKILARNATVPGVALKDTIEEIEKQQKQYEKQQKEHLKHKEKHFKIQEKVNSIYENNDLFDDKGSEIIGRDRRVIINKLNQYRNLFPKELSTFKVKKKRLYTRTTSLSR
jgi:predicted ribosome quality control (RQC) complex YloA/Tae2 family protein